MTTRKKFHGKSVSGSESSLVRGFVVAGFAAVLAIHEPVGANADVHHSLAKAAEFFTFTGGLRLLALRAADLFGTGSGTHKANVARPASE